MIAGVGGGRGGRGTYGGGRGSGGGGDDGLKGEGSNTGPEGKLPFSNWLMFTVMAAIVAAVVLWGPTKQKLGRHEEAEEMGLKAAGS